METRGSEGGNSPPAALALLSITPRPGLRSLPRGPAPPPALGSRFPRAESGRAAGHPASRIV